MIEMFLYAISIMYTPGPITILSLNQGFNGRMKQMTGYILGVGVGMFSQFLICGYIGEKFIKKEFLLYTSIIGSFYIIYLASKLIRSNIEIAKTKTETQNIVKFKDGFIMQVINPKAPIAILPIITINFPANDITGIKILLFSMILGIICLGSPSLYCFVGQFFSSFIKNKNVLNTFNKIMGLILIYIAFTILRDHVYYVIIGVNTF